jgi:hypothetical protein
VWLWKLCGHDLQAASVLAALHTSNTPTQKGQPLHPQDAHACTPYATPACGNTTQHSAQLPITLEVVTFLVYLVY